jgi:hypothetical protein
MDSEPNLLTKQYLHNCTCCGLYFDEYFPWGENGEYSTFDICDCCGIEFGYEDWCKESLFEYRTEWIKSGANWFTQKSKPDDWSLKDQLRKIGIELDEIEK